MLLGFNIYRKEKTSVVKLASPGMDGAALTGCKMEVFFWDLVSGGLLEDQI
jgi:hypothetical protein